MLPTAELVDAIKISSNPQLDLGLIGIPFVWPNWVRFSTADVNLGEMVVPLGFPLQAILV